MRQPTDYVRASIEGSSDEKEERLQEVKDNNHVVRKEAQQGEGQEDEVIFFPVAVDTHRRLPRPLDVPIPGAPDAIG